MKPFFFLIHLALAGLAVYQGYMIFYPHPAEPTPILFEKKDAGGDDKETQPSDRRSVGPGRPMDNTIIKRNLFKVMVDRPRADTRKTGKKPKPKPEKTELKLALWGTVEGVSPSKNWAVIEDLKTHQQDLYLTGDQVAGARIKEVSRNRVILIVDGKDQVLEAQTAPSPGRPGEKKAAAPVSNSGPKTLPRQAKAAGDLIKSLKFRPYMKNGTPSGVLIYGIRPGSQVLAMGLKNGDIIQTINETDIRSSNDLKEMAQTLSPDQEISISLSRRGQEKEIFYKGVDEE